MSKPSTLDRAKRNASGIAATTVTGTWLAALMLGFDWWLAALLFGYIVIVPVVAMLFDEEEGETNDGGDAGTGTADAESTADALDRLRDRYAAGELTDEAFEAKVERLLETETLEDAAEHVARERAKAEASEANATGTKASDANATGTEEVGVEGATETETVREPAAGGVGDDDENR